MRKDDQLLPHQDGVKAGRRIRLAVVRAKIMWLAPVGWFKSKTI